MPDTCFKCKAPLERVLPSTSRRHNDYVNYKHALHIKIQGQYGEYIDGEFDMVICSTCAEALVAENEFIKNGIARTEWWKM